MANTIVKDVFKNAGGGEGKTITKQELDAIKAKADSADSLNEELEGVQKELETLKSKFKDVDLEDLLKAKETLAEIQKAKEEKELADMVEVVKGYNFLDGDEAITEVAKFLNDNRCEAVDKLLLGIETINEQKKSLALNEDGTDIANGSKKTEDKADEERTESVTSILKKRGSIKTK